MRRADAVVPVLSRGHAWLCVCFFFGRRVSVVLSSSEAEYVAMALGLKEAIFLRRLWCLVFRDRLVG